MVVYNEDTQRLINEAASVYHLLADLAEATRKAESLLSDALKRLPPGSISGYVAATNALEEYHE